MNWHRGRGRQDFPALVALLLAGLLAACSPSSSRSPDIAVEPPPPGPASAAPPEIEEGRLSLFLPWQIPLSDLQQAVEAETPRYFADERKDDIASWLRDDFYRYRLARGPIELGLAGDRLTFRIPLAGSITLGGKILFGVPLQETVELTGTVTGTARPALTPDWQLQLHPEAQLRLDQADLVLPGQAKLDLRGILAPRLDGSLQNLLTEAGNRLGSSLGLRRRAESVWSELHFVRQILPDENLWFRFQPRSVGSAPLRIDAGAATLTGGLAIEGRTALVLQPRTAPLAPPAPTPMPELVPVATLPAGLTAADRGKIEVDLPIAATAAELSPWAARAFRNQRFRLDKRREMTVADASLGTAEDELILALDFSTSPTGKSAERQARGRIYLRGRPRFDPESRRLRLEDLQFDLATRSLLLRLAEWLHRPQLLAQLQRRADLDVAPLLAQAQEEAEKAMRNLRWPAGLRGGIRLDPIAVNGLEVKHGRVIVRCRITGTTTPLAIQISP